jgi:foldase protein PrsA
MKKVIKILGIVLAVLFLALVIFLKTAVGNKSIYISTGFDKDVMIKVDQTQTSRQEVMVYLTDAVAEYEELFGSDILTEDINGVPFEQYIIELVKGKLTRIKCMDRVAESRGIVLSSLEEQNIKKAAAEYYSGIDKTSIKKLSLTQEQVEEMISSRLLADKLFDDLTYEVDTEISEDEARVITIQYIQSDTVEEINVVRNRLNAGESFSSLIKEYNPYEYEYELKRGETEEAFEEAAFNLLTGEISDVVETTAGYYIIMCVNEYDKTKTAANKAQMINDNKLEVFNEVFEPYEAQLYAEYNNTLWDKVKVEDAIISEAGFLEIYEKYFQ